MNPHWNKKRIFKVFIFSEKLRRLKIYFKSNSEILTRFFGIRTKFKSIKKVWILKFWAKEKIIGMSLKCPNKREEDSVSIFLIQCLPPFSQIIRIRYLKIALKSRPGHFQFLAGCYGFRAIFPISVAHFALLRCF